MPAIQSRSKFIRGQHPGHIYPEMKDPDRFSPSTFITGKDTKPIKDSTLSMERKEKTALYPLRRGPASLSSRWFHASNQPPPPPPRSDVVSHRQSGLAGGTFFFSPAGRDLEAEMLLAILCVSRNTGRDSPT